MRSSTPLLLAAITATTLALPATSDAFQLPSGLAKPPKASAGSSQPSDSVTREGPFTIGNQQYTVLLDSKVVSGGVSTSARAATTQSTLASLQILDNHENSVYQESFSVVVSQQRFGSQLTASASLLPGDGGTALLIHFLDQPPPASGAAPEFAKESWQVFATVNGHLAPLGPVLPLGHGSDITVGGALAAVMMKNGIAVMPLASTAEVLALRVWTGSFYALVPVRFDWSHGQWGDGQRCYQTTGGTATERGCIMRLEARPQPRSPDADTLYVRLFAAPDGNTDNLLNVPVSPSAQVELLESQAIVQWGVQDNRVTCALRDIWLRVLIDGQEGWLQGQDAFDALGLPLSNPQ